MLCKSRTKSIHICLHKKKKKCKGIYLSLNSYKDIKEINENNSFTRGSFQINLL